MTTAGAEQAFRADNVGACITSHYCNSRRSKSFSRRSTRPSPVNTCRRVSIASIGCDRSVAAAQRDRAGGILSTRDEASTAGTARQNNSPYGHITVLGKFEGAYSLASHKHRASGSSFVQRYLGLAASCIFACSKCASQLNAICLSALVPSCALAQVLCLQLTGSSYRLRLLCCSFVTLLHLHSGALLKLSLTRSFQVAEHLQLS